MNVQPSGLARTASIVDSKLGKVRSEIRRDSVNFGEIR